MSRIRLFGSQFQPVSPSDDLSIINAILVGRAVKEVAKYLQNLRIVEFQPTAGTFRIWAWGTDNNDFHGMKHYRWDSANSYPRTNWEMPMRLLFTKCRKLKGVTLVGVEGASTLEEYESKHKRKDSISDEEIAKLQDLIERGDLVMVEGLGDEDSSQNEKPIKNEDPIEDEDALEERSMLEWLLDNCSRELALAPMEWRGR